MLTIRVEFLRRLFHAAGPDDLALSAGDPDPEWPPSPARLFSALVSGAGTKDNCTDPLGVIALEWLEKQPPPEIEASDPEGLIYSSITPRFAVVDENKKKSSVQNYPVRKAQEVRDGVRVSLKSPTVTYRWPDSDPDAELLESLGYRASRVGYLGRSDSTVRVTVRTEQASGSNETQAPKLATWKPDELGTVYLSVPHEGYLSKLDSAFDAFTSGQPFRRAWVANRLTSYGIVGKENAEEGERGSTLWIRFDRGISGHKVRSVAETLKALVLDRYEAESGGFDVPPVLHGHWPEGSSGYHNARWIPLPHAGYPYADGRIRGACVWLPPGVDATVRTTVAAVLASTTRLYRGSVFDVGCSMFDGSRYPWSSNPRRWTGPSRRWITVFPVVHERYSKHGLSLDEVARWCRNAGYPSPVGFRDSPVPLIDGASDLAPSQVFGTNRRRHPYSHLEITFSRPVEGPVVIGRGRGFGLGLMAPVATSSVPKEHR